MRELESADISSVHLGVNFLVRSTRRHSVWTMQTCSCIFRQVFHRHLHLYVESVWLVGTKSSATGIHVSHNLLLQLDRTPGLARIRAVHFSAFSMSVTQALALLRRSCVDVVLIHAFQRKTPFARSNPAWELN